MPLRVLLTNDDGFRSLGLNILARELSKSAECIIVAPETEKSGIGHAFSIYQPVFFYKTHEDPSGKTWVVKGTPSDCVKIGVTQVFKGRKPDMIFSGINLGDNSGISAHYSGTVAGAREGGLWGIPSAAVSLSSKTMGKESMEFAAKFARVILAFMVKNRARLKSTFLNVNFPPLSPKKIKGVKFTCQGTTMFQDNFDLRKTPIGTVYGWLRGEKDKRYFVKGSDDEALSKGYVSIVPLSIDNTDKDFLADLKQIKIQKA